MQASDPVTTIDSSEEQTPTPLINPVLAEDLENEEPAQPHTERGTLTNGAALSVSQVTVQKDIQTEGGTRHRNQKTKQRVRDPSRPITYLDVITLLIKPEVNSLLSAQWANALRIDSSWLDSFIIPVKMEIPGQTGGILEVKLLLDTGARSNFVSQRVAEILQPGYASAPVPFDKNMAGVHLHDLDSRGVIPVRWRSSNKQVPQFVVSQFHITDTVDTHYDAIMGAKTYPD